jgi:hypothetical protein
VCVSDCLSACVCLSLCVYAYIYIYLEELGVIVWRVRGVDKYIDFFKKIVWQGLKEL